MSACPPWQGAIIYAQPIIAPPAAVCLVLYKYVKKPFGWGIRQVYGGLIIEAWVGMRKFSGEIFDASPTIVAMGREDEFDVISNRKFYQNFQLSPLFFGSLGRSNFYQMGVDTAWATISMAVVISMKPLVLRGSMGAAVAIAVYNQLEDLNGLIGTFFTINDAAAQTLPNWMKVQDFLNVKQCVGKSCIEDDMRPAPEGWPADGGIEMKDIIFDYRTGGPSALSGVSVSIKAGEKIGASSSTKNAGLCPASDKAAELPRTNRRLWADRCRKVDAAERALQPRPAERRVGFDRRTRPLHPLVPPGPGEHRNRPAVPDPLRRHVRTLSFFAGPASPSAVELPASLSHPPPSAPDAIAACGRIWSAVTAWWRTATSSC